MALTDAPWAMLEPMVGAYRPHAKVPPRTFDEPSAPSVAACELGQAGRGPGRVWSLGSPKVAPALRTDDRRCRSWLTAAQTFIRWSRLGVWKRLLALTQERGVQLGMIFLDGTSFAPTRKPRAMRQRG